MTGAIARLWLLFIGATAFINGSYYLLPDLQNAPPNNQTYGVSIQQKVEKIIYYKTHKTSSTTVGSIIFRFAAQHGLKLQRSPKHYYRFTDPILPSDITLHHHFETDWESMMEHYDKVVEGGSYLSVLRNPTRRYLSHYHYFVQPGGVSFESYLGKKQYNNLLTKYFGVNNASDMTAFMDKAYDKFSFLIAEKLDESLLLLKHKWGWSLQDILYLSLNEKCAVPGLNPIRDYDQKVISCNPTFASLSPAQLQTMEDNNPLDNELYKRAYEDLDKELQAQPKQFWDELHAYKYMLMSLKQLCSSNKTIVDSCKGFLLTDRQYEAMIDSNGFTPNYTRVSVDVVPL